ncbi:MAG: DUF5829 family protein [Gemmatimonadaceae bacterium]
MQTVMHISEGNSPAVRSSSPNLSRVAFVLLAAFFCIGRALSAQPASPQIAYFNHAYAVIDAETAAAIAHSDYLKTFGVFSIHTTHADGGATWTGRYLNGRQTYLELFGPTDFQDAKPGATGLALTPDRAGGIEIFAVRLVQAGIANPDKQERTRQFGDNPVPWFKYLSLHGDGETLSIWAMEYVPSYFADPRSEKRPAEFPGDVSRKRYNSNNYFQHLMRDVSSVDVATTAHDIAMARSMFVAAGFKVTQTPQRLTASDHEIAINLDVVPLGQAGLRRIGFKLNTPMASAHVERIGQSTLTVGPGDSASWVFQLR